MKLVVGLLGLMSICCGADSRLDALRAVMVPMRGDPSQGRTIRGGTPELTKLKHLFRDWVESRLGELKAGGDERELEIRLNHELRSAEVFCEEDRREAGKCTVWWMLGYVEPLKLSRQGIFLVLQTGVGIACGFDESAYLYSWSDEGWRRVWQNEQNNYAEKDYHPQTLQSVSVSGYSKENNYVVLTLGTEPWCSSNWHNVYYRAFQLSPNLQAGPLLEGSEWTFVNNDPPIEGRVTDTDIQIMYPTKGHDSREFLRAKVLHYSIAQGEVERLDPFALSPEDFVDEWLGQAWSRAAGMWSEAPNRLALRDAHKRWKNQSGDFLITTMHCTAQVDTWQVNAEFEKTKAYFLVRWTPPYRFRMVNVSEHPWPSCNQRVPESDNANFFIRKW